MTTTPMQVAAQVDLIPPTPTRLDIVGTSVAVLPDDTILTAAWVEGTLHVWHATTDGTISDHATIPAPDWTEVALAALPDGTALLLTAAAADTITARSLTTSPLSAGPAITAPATDGLTVHDMPVTTPDGLTIIPRLDRHPLVYRGTAYQRTIALAPGTTDWSTGGLTPDHIGTADPYTVQAINPATGTSTVDATMSPTLGAAWNPKLLPLGTSGSWGWTGEWATTAPAWSLVDTTGSIIATHPWGDPRESSQTWQTTATHAGRGYSAVSTFNYPASGDAASGRGRVHLYRTGPDGLEHLLLADEPRMTVRGTAEHVPIATNGRVLAAAMAVEVYGDPDTTARTVSLRLWAVRVGTHDGILDVPTIDGWWTIGTHDPAMRWEFLVPTPLGWWVEIVAGEEHLADMELAVPAPTHPDAGEDGWVVVALMRPDTA